MNYKKNAIYSQSDDIIKSSTLMVKLNQQTLPVNRFYSLLACKLNHISLMMTQSFTI